MTKEELKSYANKLMFDMSDEEYETTLKEFEILLKKMDYIDKIEDISEYEPCSFPFVVEVTPRSDIIDNTISTEDALRNSKNKKYDQVIVPKVVE